MAVQDSASDYLYRSYNAPSSSSDALLFQLRGLEVGLPREDRAFLRDIVERVKQSDHPSPIFLAKGTNGFERAEQLGRLELESLRSVPLSALRWLCAYPSELFAFGSPPPQASIRSAALCAARLGLLTGIGRDSPLVVAALQDVGRLYLRHLAHTAAEGRRPRPQTIQQISDGLHPTVGALLVEHWGLSNEIRLAIAYHHQPAPAMPRNIRKLTTVVQAANRFTKLLVCETPDIYTQTHARELESLLYQLQIEPEPELADDIRYEMSVWRKLDTAGTA